MEKIRQGLFCKADEIRTFSTLRLFAVVHCRVGIICYQPTTNITSGRLLPVSMPRTLSEGRQPVAEAVIAVVYRGNLATLNNEAKEISMHISAVVRNEELPANSEICAEQNNHG